jgi:hypothetical protein
VNLEGKHHSGDLGVDGRIMDLIVREIDLKEINCT